MAGLRSGTSTAPVAPAAMPIGTAPSGTVGIAPANTVQTPVFARTPALAMRGIINYNSRAGERLYDAATKALDDNKYDGSPEGLLSVLGQLKERARKFGWNKTIMMIQNPNGAAENIIDKYGTMSIDRIKNHEASYIAQPTRDAQDTNLLYEAIMSSLNKDARDKITISQKDYWCNNLPSGNLLLKVMIRECQLDTNATTRTIRYRLSHLDDYLPTVSHDISRLNMYVKTLVKQLEASGETTSDLLVNLFTGYLSSSDKTFVSYIDRKLEDYEDGRKLTSDQLMLMARQKYDLLKEKGLWNSPSAADEKILALSAELKQVKDKLGNTRQDSQTPYHQQRRKPRPEWFNVEPEGPAVPRLWENKMWNWCGKSTGGKCEGYVIHRPSECKGRKRRTDRNGKPNGSNKRVAVINEAIVNAATVNGDAYDSPEE